MTEIPHRAVTLARKLVGPRAKGAALAGSLALVLSLQPADAATTIFRVNATVQATCSMSASDLAFGTYTGAIATSNTVVTVACTTTTPYTIALNAGIGAGATAPLRKMTSLTGVTLNYAVFRDSGFVDIWGTTTGSDTNAGTGRGSAQSYIAYGRIVAGQLVTPGAYADTITATIYS